MSKIYHPTFQQMRLFEAVSRHGSITRAAEEVALTQPTVSMQIRALEDKIGMPLLEKIGRSLYLTHAGEAMREASIEILARMDALEASLQDIQQAVSGPVSIAVVSTTKYFLPQMLGQFKRRFPKVEPELKILNRKNVLQRMARNEDDLYIMGRPPKDGSLVAEPFSENIIAFVARPDHPLASRSHLSLAHLVNEDIIGRETGSGTRKAVEKRFEEQGLELRSHMEFDDSEAIKQAVISGLGIAYISLHALRLEIEANEVTILDVRGFPIRRRWYAVHLEQKQLSRAALGFLDYLREEGAKTSAPASS